MCGTAATAVAGVGDRAARSFSLLTSSLSGRMSRMIFPTPTELCDFRRSMGALAVLRRRPAVIMVFAELTACHECAAEISGVGVRDGCGKGTIQDGFISGLF